MLSELTSLFQIRNTAFADSRCQSRNVNVSYQNIKKQYQARRLCDLTKILEDPEKWKEFQYRLRAGAGGITNSSVKENLLSALNADAAVSCGSYRRYEYASAKRVPSLGELSCDSDSSSSCGIVDEYLQDSSTS
jgi:hypothetical protein